MELDLHMQRLQRSIQYLRMDPPPILSDPEAVKAKSRKLLRKNRLADCDAVVRLQVWREGGRGFAVDRDAGTGYGITVSPLPKITEPVTLATVGTRRIPSVSLDSRHKLSNSINYVLAAAEAAEQGADDALMLTVEGYLSETTIANIFWRKGETVFTPSVSCDLLPGITRKLVIELLEQELKVPVQQGAWKQEAIMECDAAWICNSVREVVEVGVIDDKKITGSGRFVKSLKHNFASMRDRRLQ